MISIQNLRVSREPVNPHDCGWKNLFPNYHEDHVAGKGDNSLQHHHLVHKFIPMNKVMNIPAAKVAVDKEWEKLEKIPAWDLTKVKSKSEVINEARTKGAKVHFVSLMDICLLKNAETGDKAPKIQTVVFRSDMVKDILGLEQYSLNKDHQHLKWRQQNSWISNPDCQDAQEKQRTHYLPIPRSKWKMLQNYGKISDRNVQTFGFVYHTNGQNHGPVWKMQLFLLSEICMVILWQDCYGKGNLRKSYWSTGWEKVSKWECLFVHCETVYSYLCMWMTLNWLERNKMLIRCRKYSTKKSIWERQHLFLIMYTWDVFQNNAK